MASLSYVFSIKWNFVIVDCLSLLDFQIFSFRELIKERNSIKISEMWTAPQQFISPLFNLKWNAELKIVFPFKI